MSNTKLSPIYAALDSHQYNRAIKLCLALPPQHLLGQALLAHAYAKSGQRLKSLITIQTILLGTAAARNNNNISNVEACFPELQVEIKYALERRQELAAAGATGGAESAAGATAAMTAAAAPAPATTKKVPAKKGRKKPAPAPAATVAKTPPPADDFDWIDQLDIPPSIPPDWMDVDFIQQLNEPPSDPTLLGTLTTTLGFLRCYLTSYQLYTWVISQHPQDLEWVKQCYLLGLTVVMAPTAHYQQAHVLTNLWAQLQVTALQVARLQQEQQGNDAQTGVASSISIPATAWAAQTALWQLMGHKEDSELIQLDDTKRAMLPRLAESLAQKACQSSHSNSSNNAHAATNQQQQQPPPKDDNGGQTNPRFLIQTENFWLYCRTLQIQQKYQQQLEAIQQRLDDPTMEFPRKEALQEEKARVLIQLGNFAAARVEWADLLRRHHPDQWEFWLCHLEHDDTENKMESWSLIQEIIADTEAKKKSFVDDNRYPLRGPYLAKLERLRLLLLLPCDNNSKKSEDVLESLLQEVMSYGEMLGFRASCAVGDLLVYIQSICQHGTGAQIQKLVDWCNTKFLTARPASSEAKERRKELRGYIFGVKVVYEIYACITASSKNNKRPLLPDWREILQIWNEFKAFEDPIQAQKEHRAGDDLILLAVQQLILAPNDGSVDEASRCHNLVLAAIILEAAIDYSPDNAYLKISALLVYGDLNAIKRSLELFKLCYIKHIQYESCAYLILDRLCSGGFYQETLGVCKDILRCQTASIRDAAEYTGRAMENGTLTKANEFMTFQRQRINKSLTTLEAKGLILDCAPMFMTGESHDLGVAHGVVGGPDDKQRVCQMISEAHNPHGAFSLLRLRGSAESLSKCFTENRDLDILKEIDILQPRKVPTREHILSASLRRCHHHNLLIRASLCLDATKGPKKGKVTKSSPELTRRCTSLLNCVRDAQEYAENMSQPDSLSVMTKSATITMLYLCRAVVAVGGGTTDGSGDVLDTMETREEMANKFLTDATLAVKECHNAFTLGVKTNVVPLVGNFLSDCLVSVFALIQMCASTLDIYGWGKRKRGTRKSAGALADLCVALKAMVIEMKSSLLEQPCFMPPQDLLKILDGVVDAVAIEQTQTRLRSAQLETKTRLEQILSKILETLNTFDVEV